MDWVLSGVRDDCVRDRASRSHCEPLSGVCRSEPGPVVGKGCGHGAGMTDEWSRHVQTAPGRISEQSELWAS